MTAELAELFQRYPLPAGYTLEDTYRDTIQASGLVVHVAGFAARGEAGVVTGSAGALSGDRVQQRAYFELLERVALSHAKTRQSIPLFSGDGELLEVVSAECVFPSAKNPSLAYSVSNGVAAGATFEQARAHALAEAVERDAVLGSYYGLEELVVQPPPDVAVSAALGEDYSLLFRSVRVDHGAAGPDYAVGIALGLPKHAQAPLLLGFGARKDEPSAVQAALNEAVQQLGFLWGEALPDSEPRAQPTPDYHQDYALWPGSHPGLVGWLEGENEKYRGVIERMPLGPDAFADVTPPHLAGRLWVLKAMQPGFLPLLFGRGAEGVELPEPLRTHPIS